MEKNGIKEDQGTIELKKLLKKFEDMPTEEYLELHYKVKQRQLVQFIKGELQL